MKTRKIAYLGMLMALALVLSYVESLIPFAVGIPGVKLYTKLYRYVPA